MPSKVQVLAFLAGLAVPPVVTKAVIQPAVFKPNFDELYAIKQELDFVGWQVRHIEEEKGFKKERLYEPKTLYQGHW